MAAAYTAVKSPSLANIAQFTANPGHCLSQVLLMHMLSEQKSLLSLTSIQKKLQKSKCGAPVLCWHGYIYLKP